MKGHPRKMKKITENWSTVHKSEVADMKKAENPLAQANY